MRLPAHSCMQALVLHGPSRLTFEPSWPTPEPADGWMEIRFQDTGTGIQPEDLPKVFEPYFTTKEVGIGLGLALTKQIVEEHGGQIEIFSDPGQGTDVRLRLPVGAPQV